MKRVDLCHTCRRPLSECGNPCTLKPGDVLPPIEGRPPVFFEDVIHGHVPTPEELNEESNNFADGDL